MKRSILNIACVLLLFSGYISFRLDGCLGTNFAQKGGHGVPMTWLRIEWKGEFIAKRWLPAIPDSTEMYDDWWRPRRRRWWQRHRHWQKPHETILYWRNLCLFDLNVRVQKLKLQFICSPCDPLALFYECATDTRTKTAVRYILVKTHFVYSIRHTKTYAHRHTNIVSFCDPSLVPHSITNTHFLI